MNEDVTLTKTQGFSDLSGLLKSGTIECTLDCNGCLGSKSMTLEERLEIWIVARCCQKNSQPRRVAELNAIFNEIYTDKRFLRYRNAGNPDDYEDALFLMWQYFLNNLCKATTARTSGSFMETRSYTLNRLLASFKGNLKNLWMQRQQRESREEQPYIDESGVFIDPAEQVPYYDPEPDLEPDLEMFFKKFLQLLEEDPMGELNDKDNILRGIKNSTKEATQEPYILTAQTYLLMRYRNNKTIQEIADELDIPRGTLQGGAKPKRWKALARKYAEMAMDEISE